MPNLQGFRPVQNCPVSEKSSPGTIFLDKFTNIFSLQILGGQKNQKRLFPGRFVRNKFFPQPSAVMVNYLVCNTQNLRTGPVIFFKFDNECWLAKKDIPHAIIMVILDIIAPILLMYGVANTATTNVSLLNNFD